jgi:hypothetical protein
MEGFVLMSAETCFDPQTHRPRLLSAQCETCIYRPSNPMHLRPGALRSITADALREGCQGVICHDTLSYGAYPGFGGALCRGFYDKFGPRNNFIRIMGRLGGFTEVDPPATPDAEDAR